jgi:hypothetical protein
MKRSKILNKAILAARLARADGEGIPKLLTKRSKANRRIIDDEVLKEMKQNRKSEKEQRRQIQVEEDIRLPSTQPKLTWDYIPGQLVKIKQNPGKRALSMLGYSGIKPGDSGIIIEKEGKWLKVLGPQGLQTWCASWIWNITDDE